MDIEVWCQKVINDLAEKLVVWREGNELSKRRFANLSTLAESTIRNIEKGAPNLDLSSLVKIRLAYNISLIRLFNEDKIIPKPINLPITIEKFEKSLEVEKNNIGKRIKALQDYRGLSPDELSLLAHNSDYSDTLKYQRGEKNIELRTIIKYADGLEVEIIDIFDYKGAFPSNKFIGKIKK